MTPSEPLLPEQALHTIAASHPDYAAFAADYADTGQMETRLPPDILEDTLAAVAQDPNLAAPIESLRQQTEAGKSFTTGGEVATLLAVAFLLRTHLKIRRNTSGKWEFLIEHKPGDSKLLTRVLTKLEKWMG